MESLTVEQHVSRKKAKESDKETAGGTGQVAPLPSSKERLMFIKSLDLHGAMPSPYRARVLSNERVPIAHL